uniref:CHK domain-containing protein n=1 Tax=Rhabditophanes sp. KR3021 TaxID=114890 RepID=A0AC35TLA7_9BILA
MNNYFVEPTFIYGNIDGTNTEVKWLIECLEKNCLVFKKLIGRSRIKDIKTCDCSNGKGFISKVYKVSILFEKKDILPYQVIIKIPCLEKVKQSCTLQKVQSKNAVLNADMVQALHLRECEFYETFTCIKSLKYPDCYGTREWNYGKQEGVIILKYLGDIGVSNDFFKSFNLQQMENLFTQILYLQSHFLTSNDETRLEKFPNLFKPERVVLRQPLFRKNWKLIKSFIDDNLWKNIDEDVQTLIDNIYYIIKYVTQDLLALEGNSYTFVMGDLWNFNILHQKNENNEAGDEICGIIDWQTFHCGSIGSDLARSIVICTDHVLRKEVIEWELLPNYYTNLKNEVESRGSHFKITWDMFKLNYDFCFIVQTFQLLYISGLILHTQNAPIEKGNEIWDARKKETGLKVYHAFNDSIQIAKRLRPEFLIIK